VSDHRINLTLYKLPQILDGEALGEIIDALVQEHQAELLAAKTRDRGFGRRLGCACAPRLGGAISGSGHRVAGA